MPDPQIQYFQAVATAIPTLAVAAAFTSKAFEKERHIKEGASSRQRELRFYLVLLLGITFAVAAIGGERLALEVLAEGNPRRQDVLYLNRMIAILGVSLAGIVLMPLIPEAYPPRAKHSPWSRRWAWFWGVLAVVGALWLITSVPLRDNY